MERPAPQSVAGPSHEKMLHGRIPGQGHAPQLLPHTRERGQQTVHCFFYTFYGQLLQLFGMAVTGGSNAADDIGTKGALPVYTAHRFQYRTIRE